MCFLSGRWGLWVLPGQCIYKGCNGLAVLPSLSPKGLLVFPWTSSSFLSPSHVHSPNPHPYLHTLAWDVFWLTALSLPSISSYPLPPVLESSAETSAFQVSPHCPRTKSGHPHLVSQALWKLTPMPLSTLLPLPLHQPPADSLLTAPPLKSIPALGLLVLKAQSLLPSSAVHILPAYSTHLWALYHLCSLPLVTQ